VAEHEHEPTPEELLEQIKQLKVSDLLLSTLSTVAQLGYAKLDPKEPDLEQAKLAIESLRVLLPVLEGSVPPELSRDFGQVLANLQLAYASAVADAGGEQAAEEVSGEPGGPAAEGEESAPEGDAPEG
jgi:hypothetical protein